jgi:hypothetical protein
MPHNTYDIIYIKTLFYFSTRIGGNPTNYFILDFGYLYL